MTEPANMPPTVPGPIGGGPVLVDRDQEHLKMLSIFHYVFAGLNALGGCVPLLYVVIGAVLLAVPPGGEGDPPPAVGWAMMGMGGCGSIIGWTLAVLNFMAARALGAARRRTLCMVTAGINCIFVPLGTTLGIFTFVVLSRPSVQARFSEATLP